MTTDFERTLAERARAAGVTLTAAEITQHQKYFDLLARWNQRVNLTSLPLENFPSTTITRLFIEPLAAATHVPRSPIAWLDVGSGGGSPAIPLKIARPQARLTMVESRGRKAAFLREVVRALEMTDVQVLEDRFEALFSVDSPGINADLVTVRAVRPDAELLRLCRCALATGGRLLLFRSTGVGSAQIPEGLKRLETVQLAQTQAQLDVLEAV